MAGPISPNEVAATKSQVIPEVVFEAFNELIAEKFTAGLANVKQKDVIARILAKDTTIEKSQIFALGMLNVEEVYREKGWDVEYDKPAYNESYDANFTFRAK